MILDLHSTLRVVFSIFAVFWIVAVIVLFIATGLLLKRAEKLSKKSHAGPADHHQITVAAARATPPAAARPPA